MGLKTYGAMGAMLAVGVGVSQADKSMNYTPVDATVTASVVDCYVKSNKTQLVERGSEDRAYMGCDVAPMAAAVHGYDASDVHVRVKFEYEFVSPIDGSVQTGDGSREGSAAAEYNAEGKVFTIYAHKEDPAKRRF